MNRKRRDWFNWAITAVFGWILAGRRAQGQGLGLAQLSGRLTDDSGQPIVGATVQAFDGTGNKPHGSTDGNGEYKLPAPTAHAYIVVFRDRQSSTKLLEVRQLTGGTNQLLAVTVPTQGFLGAYNALQGIEALSACVLNDREGRLTQNLAESFPPNDRLRMLDAVMSRLAKDKITEAESSFLQDKARTITKLLA